jgi:hypothetical protein
LAVVVATGSLACTDGAIEQPGGGFTAMAGGAGAAGVGGSTVMPSAGTSGGAVGGSGGTGGDAGRGGQPGSAGMATGGAAGSGGSAPAVVDASSMSGKHLFGYQGWFACPGDGGPSNRWVHWFRGNTPSAANATFDLWPDVSELAEDELFDTNLSMQGGAPARLFSAIKEPTVVRHFKWMQEAGIDGVFVQRFLADVRDTSTRKVRDQVLLNARAGAERHGRVFSVMYDISGASESTLVADLEAEWKYLVEVLEVTDSPRYLRHAGKPVLALWGLGFSDRPGTAAQAQTLVDALKEGAHPTTLLGGVPTHWRTLAPNEDTKTDPAWASVYRSFDVLSPWAVGRYVDDAGADAFAEQHFAADLAELEPRGIGYMPVVFPGFSWHNLKNVDPLNQIPRRGGAFYWRQAYNAINAGSSMLYGAMFDEVDEGTAFFKVVAHETALPAQGTFLPLSADGHTLPSDWYLQLAGAATRALNGTAPLTPTMPLTPP